MKEWTWTDDVLEWLGIILAFIALPFAFVLVLALVLFYALIASAVIWIPIAVLDGAVYACLSLFV